jgi:hypothetical protein
MQLASASAPAPAAETNVAEALPLQWDAGVSTMALHTLAINKDTKLHTSKVGRPLEHTPKKVDKSKRQKREPSMTPTPSPIRRELIYFAEDRLLAGEVDLFAERWGLLPWQ